MKLDDLDERGVDAEDLVDAALLERGRRPRGGSSPRATRHVVRRPLRAAARAAAGRSSCGRPERTLTPMASTSSSIAVRATSRGRAVQARVDDLHAGVAQRAGDHLDAAIVAVEADLGDQHADRRLVVIRKRRSRRRSRRRRAATRRSLRPSRAPGRPRSSAGMRFSSDAAASRTASRAPDAAWSRLPP